MTARRGGGYSAHSQHDGLPRPWWQRVPQPIATVVVTAWSVLPRPIRATFIPIGRWINPHQTTSATGDSPGADMVPGVSSLRAQGFEPIEAYTGFVQVAELWPPQHRRWVEETREWRLAHPECGGRLWLVRSPWPAFGVQDALNVVWTWVDFQDAVQSSPDTARERVLRERAAEALAWDEARAVAWAAQQSGA